MAKARLRRSAAACAIALAAAVGLVGCDKTPPVLTVQPGSFVVGSQIGPSVVHDEPRVPQTTLPLLLRWSATDRPACTQLTYSARHSTDAISGDMRIFTKATSTEMLVSVADYNDDSSAGRFAGWAIAAHDCDGNTSAEAIVRRGAEVIQENGLHGWGYFLNGPVVVSPAPSSAWTAVVDPNHSAGAAVSTTTAGATIALTYDFKPGEPVAVVARSGSADVLVDGVRVATVHSFGLPTAPRTIAWGGHISGGTHTIAVRHTGADPTPTVVDAFIVR